MKILKRSVLLLSLGCMTVLTSCVDDEVSPEVDNLRQAQVNFLDAQAEFERARAANQNAQAALAQADAAVREADADFRAAEAEEKAAEARITAAEAEERFQESILRLSELVNDNAQEILNNYTAAKNDADGIRDNIEIEKADLARYESFIPQGSNAVVDYDKLIAAIEADIAEKEAEKEAKEEAIARLENIDTNAEAVEEEIEEINDSIAPLRSDLAAAELDKDQFEEETYNPITTLFSNARSFEISIPNLENDVATEEDKVATAEENVATAEENVQQAEERVNSIEGQIAPFQAEFDTREAAYLTALAKAESLLDAWIQAKAAFEAAAVNNNPGDAAYDDAEKARDDAVVDFEDFTGLLQTGNSYSTDPNVIKDNNQLEINSLADSTSDYGKIIGPFTEIDNDPTFTSLKSDLNTAESGLNTAETNLQREEDNLIKAEDALIFDQNRLANAQSNLQEIFTQFEVANLTELKALRDDAIANLTEKDNTRNELDAKITELDNLKGVLEDYLDNGEPSVIETEIQNLKNGTPGTPGIDDLDDDIADLEADIVDEEINEQELQDLIARTQEKIDNLTLELEAQEALAENYLDDFYAAIEEGEAAE